MDICQNQPALLDASATNYQSLLWTSSGDGIFTDPNVLNPTYVPGENDITTGAVELTLECSGGNNVITDAMMVYIVYLPIVWPGEAVQYCADIEEVELNGLVLNTDEFEWSTSGDGTFEDPYALETIYYPGVNDIISGDVEIGLEGFAVAPCDENVLTTFGITFLPLPEVTFDEIENFCHNSPAYELTEGSPEGGEYSGTSVIDGWFYPEVAGIGAHVLTYSYVDGNGCENSADLEVVVDDCTGIADAGNASINVTPNPGKGVFELLINGFDAKNGIIEIYNTSGKLVYKKELSNEFPGSLSIDISSQPDGIYYMYLNNSELIFNEKIVIVR
jgi:hypothetical protein